MNLTYFAEALNILQKKFKRITNTHADTREYRQNFCCFLSVYIYTEQNCPLNTRLPCYFIYSLHWF